MTPQQANRIDPDRGVVSRSSVLRLLAAGSFGFSVHQSAGWASLAALIGIGLLGSSLLPDTQWSESTMRLSIGALGIASLLVGMISGIVGFPQPSQGFPLSFAIVSAAVTVIFMVGRGRADVVVIVLGAMFLVGWAAHVVATYPGERVGIDVYQSHEAAADAVRSWMNPYTDAVSVRDGSPLAEEGDTIDGYSYPPVTLVGYVGSSLAFGDSRWATVIAMASALALLVSVGGWSATSAGAVVLLASMPLHRAVVWSGWTEPLTVVLLVAGLASWRRAGLAGALLGLALATKQYMVLLVPLLWFAEQRPRHRSWMAMGVAFASLLPLALLDISALRSTLIDRPLGLGFRSDSQSLTAVVGGQLVPLVVVVIVAVAMAAWLGSQAFTIDRLLACAALVFASVFVFSLAYPNYWWMVQWLAAISAVAPSGRTSSLAKPGVTRTAAGE